MNVLSNLKGPKFYLSVDKGDVKSVEKKVLTRGTYEASYKNLRKREDLGGKELSNVIIRMRMPIFVALYFRFILG